MPDSRASESSPTEPVSQYAAALIPIVRTAARTDSKTSARSPRGDISHPHKRRKPVEETGFLQDRIDAALMRPVSALSARQLGQALFGLFHAARIGVVIHNCLVQLL